MTDDELKRLRQDVQYLKDRTEILDCIANHARACDRHDADLMTAVYHDDGVDEHGFTVNPGPAYGEWANQVHAASAQATLHHLTTHLCEIDGDVAHCESYVFGGLLSPDGRSTTVLSGRYLDRLERREGRWRIAVRRSTVEWLFTADSSFLQSEAFRRQGYLKGTRDRSDLSYARPLELDTEPAERW
jgi:ketosteroid isomerase-like protein